MPLNIQRFASFTVIATVLFHFDFGSRRFMLNKRLMFKAFDIQFNEMDFNFWPDIIHET